MPGTATVTIKGVQWQVNLATTYYELSSGLGGLASINPGTGMLFDLGYEQWVTITTVPMMFSLDVIIISDDLVVMSVERDVEPGRTLEKYCRYWLEVNAEEAEGISIGNPVTVLTTSLDDQPDWIADLLSIIMPIMMLGIMVMMVGSMMSGVKE